MNLRAAEARDAEAIAGVHVASWRAAYRGLMSDEVLDLWVLEDHGGARRFYEVVGFVADGRRRDEASGLRAIRYRMELGEGLPDSGPRGSVQAPDRWRFP